MTEVKKYRIARASVSGRSRVGTHKVASLTVSKAQVLAEIRKLSAGKHRSYFAAVDAQSGALAGVANNGRLSKGKVKNAVAKLARNAYRLQPNSGAAGTDRWHVVYVDPIAGFKGYATSTPLESRAAQGLMESLPARRRGKYRLERAGLAANRRTSRKTSKRTTSKRETSKRKTSRRGFARRTSRRRTTRR